MPIDTSLLTNHLHDLFLANSIRLTFLGFGKRLITTRRTSGNTSTTTDIYNFQKYMDEISEKVLKSLSSTYESKYVPEEIDHRLANLHFV